MGRRIGKRIIICCFVLTLLCCLFTACTDNSSTPSTYLIKYQASEGGTISGIQEQQVLSGNSSQQVTAIPQDGYAFDCWSDGLTSETRQDFATDSNVIFTAYFRKLVEYTLLYSSDENGTIVGDAHQTVYEHQNGTAVKAIPNQGYKFVKWSDGLTVATRTDINIVDNLSVTAIFEKIVYFSLSYFAEFGGSIEGNTTQSIEKGYSGETVTAIADTGYEFVKWSDGLTTATRTDINVMDNITVTAIFQKAIYKIEYSYYGKGTIEGETTQNLYYGETTSIVKAVAADCFEFVGWTDGVTTPERQDIVTTNKVIYASFRAIPVYNVQYIEYNEVYIGRYIEGETNQKVRRGGSATEVTAKTTTPEYIFLCWDDGVTTPTRKDENITQSKTIRAIFAIGARVNFFVDGIGGTIEGMTNQTLLTGHSATNRHIYEVLKENNIDSSEIFEQTTTVKAVPSEGYVFVGWSDGVTTAERGAETFNRSYKIAAYFEPIQKEFVYNYMGATSDCSVQSVSFARDEYLNVKYVIPQKDGYTFAGWYADDSFKTMVVNSEGKLMLGRYVTALQSDNLYARWIANDDTTVRHKILIVLTDKIKGNVQLKTRPAEDEYKYVDIQLTIGELHLLTQVSSMLYTVLNEWMSDIVTFEIDTYLMNNTMDGGCFRKKHFEVKENEEIQTIAHLYDSILAVSNLHDYDKVFEDDYAGWGTAKYAGMQFDQYLHIPISYILYDEDAWANGFYEHYFWSSFARTAIHEIIHTVETILYPSNSPLHEAISEYLSDSYQPSYIFEVFRLFLRNETIVNGELVGIPKNYWKEK